MCGIAGFHGPGSFQDLETMTHALAHRGPDAHGFHADAGNALYLGHRRLSIIDLDDGGQPMWSADKALCVVFNGEIYNHRELRAELESRGHRFATDHSDTETLLHGYREWKEDLPRRLNGMFAFALWDSAAGRLFLARDRFGEKPLYWGRRNGLFAFGSELRVFDEHSAFPVDIDPDGVRKLLAYGFIPAPSSFYRGVRKLPAGSWMTYELKSGGIREESYWRYRLPREKETISVEDAAEELRHCLGRAVRRRMIADVPLGVFLSGGIDSGAVATLACGAAGGEPVRTFSIGFEEASYDETPFAREMADRLDTRHTTEVVDLEFLLRSSRDILARLDEPIGDPSILPTFALSRMTARHVTVALSGDGGDELLAGYDNFAALRVAGLFERFVPELARKAVLRLVDLVPRSSRNMSLDFKLRRALGGVGRGAALWNPQWLAPASAEMLEDLLHEPVDAEELYSDAVAHWNAAQSDDPIDRTSEFFVRFYLQDGILAKVDRASMLNSLETRAVFLDNDLVAFLQGVPTDLKFRRGVRKFILKEAMKGLMPQNILERPKKGFGIPLVDWVGRLPLDEAALGALGLDARVARGWRERHVGGRGDYRLFLWNWFVLQSHARHRMVDTRRS